MRVLDLGGTAESWMRSPVSPAEVVLINLDDKTTSNSDRIRSIRGNACDAASVLRASGVSLDFDLVYSNSLIEHVGGHEQRLLWQAKS
jgi:hypothetical protein